MSWGKVWRYLCKECKFENRSTSPSKRSLVSKNGRLHHGSVRLSLFLSKIKTHISSVAWISTSAEKSLKFRYMIKLQTIWKESYQSGKTSIMESEIKVWADASTLPVNTKAKFTLLEVVLCTTERSYKENARVKLPYIIQPTNHIKPCKHAVLQFVHAKTIWQLLLVNLW